jgi:hypothetical protein
MNDTEWVNFLHANRFYNEYHNGTKSERIIINEYCSKPHAPPPTAHNLQKAIKTCDEERKRKFPWLCTGGGKPRTKKAPKPKRQTRKKMNRVSLGGNVYSKNEFLRIMHQQHADKIYWRMKGDKIIPPGKIKKADLEGWMTFSGAHFI